MKIYRAAIVGLGRMGSTIDEEVVGYPSITLPYSIAASCQASERLELVAGSDLLEEKRAAFGTKWGVDALYADYIEMIEKEKPDLVAVCTKGDVHADMGVKVAAMGVPMIYMEKAMACSMGEADLVLESCSEHGTVFNTGVLRRFDNRYSAVRDVIESGAIGEVRTAVHFAGSNLLHGHIHSMDTLSFLLGDPKIAQVKGELLPRDLVIENNRLDKDPSSLYHLLFENGVEGWTIPAGHWEFEVTGTEGSVRSRNNGVSGELRKAIEQGGKRRSWEEVPFSPLESRKRARFVEPRSAVVDCLEDLVEAYENKRPSLGNVELTHHITEACFAVAESHQQDGKWIELPGVDRDLYIFHV